MIKQALRKILYEVGLLGLIHRYRNARTLTTFMFHRVLPPSSAAYQFAEKEFTFTIDGFSSCLEFIDRHYNVIRLSDLEEAKRSGRQLPRHAALITFDDGWLDTVEHAYPELKRRGLSGIAFIATEILDFPSERWWQDALVSVLCDPDASEELGRQLDVPTLPSEHSMAHRNHALAAALAARPVADRIALLTRYVRDAIPGRQMMNRADLEGVDRASLELAAHGYTHAPLCNVADPAVELQTSHDKILEQGGYASMSFPHGSYDTRLIELAERAGFSTIFTSDANLTDTSDLKKLPRVLGRVHLPENEWTCDADGISFPKLATFLFFRPIAGASDAIRRAS